MSLISQAVANVPTTSRHRNFPILVVLIESDCAKDIIKQCRRKQIFILSLILN